MPTISLRLTTTRLCACLLLAGLACHQAAAGVVTGRGTPGPTNLGESDASTLVRNPDGVGHMLILPYFSAQDGNATLLSVTNVDPINAKVAKLRFRGAANGDTLSDLSLFLAPGDVWTGALTQDAASGLAQLSTADASCTLPAMSAGTPYAFSTARLNPALPGAELARHTREGYAEIIAMADVPDSLVAASLFRSIVARNCTAPALLATLKDASTEAAAVAMGFATPTTGLQANWTILNVVRTLTFSGEATAIEARNAEGVSARGNYVLFAQTDGLVANADAFSADPVLRSTPLASKTSSGASTPYAPAAGLPVQRATLSDFPDLSTPYVAGLTIPMQQTAQLNQALAVKSVVNEYASDASLFAATDWVVSLPTRRYAVGLDYRQTPAVPVYSMATGPGGVEYFASDTLVQPGNCLVADQLQVFDREGGTRPAAAARARQFCGATSVLLFGANGSSALSASLAVDSTDGYSFTNGWARLSTTNRGLGWPLLGQAFIKASNPQAAAGVSGNYGIASAHSHTR